VSSENAEITRGASRTGTERRPSRALEQGSLTTQHHTPAARPTPSTRSHRSSS